MPDITTVIFDLGRVLVRIRSDGEHFTALTRRIGVRPEEAFAAFGQAPEFRRFMTGDVDPRGFHRLVSERFRVDIDFDVFAEAWCDLFTPMPGMEALFRGLAERYRLGILSDTDPLHWAAIRRRMPWLDVVRRPTLSFEVGQLKPHPAMYAAAAANAGQPPERCLFIDDLAPNVDGARRAGMAAVLFTDADGVEKELALLGVSRPAPES